ncbi:MAG: response regulator transcription factor [Saprospiraceae bacterium]|nr:response regulator transcription factor [Saprospiraceae bacterium]
MSAIIRDYIILLRTSASSLTMINCCRIVIADDHQIILDGLRNIIHATGLFEVVGTVSDGRGVISLLAAQRPDLLLLDLNLPGKDGLAILKEAKARFPRIKVLILTSYHSPELAGQALDAGADGYLLKDHGKDELMDALQLVVAGVPYLSEKIRRNMAPGPAFFQDAFQQKQGLTDRETEILRLIAQSFSNREIATMLYLSEFTVQTHRRNLKRKLQAENTADLVRFAIENGIS